MVEKLSHNPEHHRPSPEHHHQAPEKTYESHNHKHKENISEIRQKAATEALSADEVATETDQTAVRGGRQAFVNKELKDLAYDRTLKRVRQNLSPASRAFSRVVHQPVVELISEAAAKTIGRPSGVLGGGLVALAGTSAYYYIAKHYGYEYNFGVFVLLLLSGFAIGWIIEFLIRTMHGRR